MRMDILINGMIDNVCVDVCKLTFEKASDNSMRKKKSFFSLQMVLEKLGIGLKKKNEP